MINPIITIGIAVYNINEEMLTECIESVTASDCKDIEILIVDDCSQNNSYEVCKRYADADDRIVLIKNEKNRGIGYVRNLMIERACGRWIFFLDGDDVFGKSYRASVAYADGMDYDILMYDYKCFEGEPCSDKSFYDGTYIELSKTDLECCCIACLTESPCDIIGRTLAKGCTVKAFKKEFLIKNNLRFIENLKISEDSLFLADALHVCGRALYFPFVIYYYRSNPHSVTNAYNGDTEKLRARYLRYAKEKIDKYYPNQKGVMSLYEIHKISSAVYREYKLNIFHKDNPKSYIKRREDFIRFLSSEPYGSLIRNIDLRHCKWKERRLIIALSKKKSFFMLNLIFKNPIAFRIYGGFANRAERIMKWKRH